MAAAADSNSGAPPRARPVCRHCGAPLLDESARRSGFCCAGCAYVHRLVHEHGLDSYYHIKDEVTAPVDATVFQPRDFSWLATLQTETEKSAGRQTPEMRLSLQGISCAGCVWLIERLFQQMPGARTIIVNAQLGQMELRWTAGEFSAVEFTRKLQAFNYLAGPPDDNESELESRALTRRIGLCTAFAMNVMLFTLPVYFGMEQTFAYARLFETLSLLFGTLSLIAGGGYFLQKAWQGLRLGFLHIDLPISLGILGAYLGSLYGWLTRNEAYIYFDFVSGFIVLMLAGRWAQVLAVEHNRRRLLARQPRPQQLPVVQDDGTTSPVEPEALKVGQTYLLRSGQIVPVESQLAEAASFSLASINGESVPRDFQPGQRVPAGALNLTRAEIRLTARQLWADSLLAQLTRTREHTGTRHDFLERIIRGYLIGILGIATLAGLGWGFATGDLLHTGAIVTAILVVSCPCAIGLAFPLADEMASVGLRRRGVFVREADLWARLHRVRRVVFDKTGTLTLETPVLQNPAALDALAPAARAALFTLVHDNPHPVGQCLLENLLGSGTTPDPLPETVQEEVGRGLFAGQWSLGRAGWRDAGPPDGATVLAHDGQEVARFTFADTVRADVPVELTRLAQRGLECHILSGDLPAKVRTLAQALKLPPQNAHGGMTPQEKAAWMHRDARRDTLMLGDGANDSLAFDTALCRGTPVIHRGILEQKADFYYLGRGISGIRALFEINDVRRRTQWLILIFSVVYNVLAVGFAVAGKINPLVAAILMPANSLLTLALVTSGMRKVFSPGTQPH